MESKKITIPNRNGQGIMLSAVINYPDGFDASKKYSAVVVSQR